MAEAETEKTPIVTHIVDQPISVNGNSVNMARLADKSCEAGKSKIKGRIQGCGRFPEILTFLTRTCTNLQFRRHRK